MPPKTIYTVGHSNRDLRSFLRLLKAHDIEALIDVRRYPTSRKYPHFDKENLASVLSQADMFYYWLGEALGGWRKWRGGSISGCLKSPGFRAYVEHMKTEEFLEAAKKLMRIAMKYNSVVMCAEKFPWRCHRYFLSDWLKVQGFRVIHIIDEGRVIIHKLSRCARVINGKLIYV